MGYDHKKIEPIFNYYQNNGFHHSLQEVADAVHITKKTLFNRYTSKENMELCLIDYWQSKSNERFSVRIEYANHAVEKLMMFIFELQYCKKNETNFFKKAKEIFLKNSKQPLPHFKQLEEIFIMGLLEDLFHFETDPKVYANFFFFNVLFLLLNDTLVYTDYLSFLLDPILTESGKTVFREINIEYIFK